MTGLTDQQQKSLDLDKHISLTANAGSGKTRVLVERYVNAVLGGVNVEQILCLTFTEKAALELRQKIGERIGTEFRQAVRDNTDSASVLFKARGRMLEANISTIHSFCSQMLREFPVEAGIDANFKVLEDFDASSLKEDACDEAVRDFLAKERPGAHPPEAERRVHDLLVKVGYRNVLELLLSLLDNREKLEHARIAGRKLVPDQATVRTHWMSLVRAVENVMRENVKRTGGDFTAEADALGEIANGSSASIAPLLIELRSTLDKVLTKAGTPRKRDVVIEGSARYYADDALSILQTAFRSLEEASGGQRLSDADSYFRLLQTIVDLYVRCEEIYSHKKFLMGALDFDDLQISTLRLLKSKDTVAGMLAARYRHIMVDEFQDTNFLQYEILLSLLNDFATDARLFVVGDPKQSIYRFRNAQVEVSQTASERLSGSKHGLSLTLAESFRMNREIAAFVNDIFREAFKRSKLLAIAGLPSLNQTEYNELVARRPNGGLYPVEMYVREKSGGEESSAENTASRSDRSSGEDQALFAASRIRQMIDSGEKVRLARENERERKIDYSDIAVLLRTRAKLPLLEYAFTKYNVPYIVSAGVGFYSAQEIFDLTNYLTFLLDNTSDIALLTVLRSPFFGISENELYAISLSRGRNLFERLCEFSQSESAGDEVKYAALVLKEEIQLAQRQTIPQLINRILERTGWLGAYTLSPTAGQRIANLRKMLGIAREFEGRGFNSLFDFVERIKYLKETAREGQAPVEEAVNAVRIMTVHAAKGLEFPVVLVPFCDSTSRRGPGIIINDDIGVLPLVGNEIPAELSLYREFETINEQAEVARLFYVACTRAMDKLILTTGTKKSSNGINTFADVLAKSLDISAAPSSGYYDLPGGKIMVHAASPEVRAGVVERSASPVQVGEILLDPIPADIDGEMYSATLLQTFRLCPTKYFLRYRLGLPAQDPAEWRGGLEGTSAGLPNPLEEYDDTILATMKGQIVHSVLENILSVDQRDDGSISRAASLAVSGAVGQRVGNEAKARLIETVSANVRNALATLDMISAPGKKLMEQTITRRFNSDFIMGTLDLLIEDENGFHIYDYKTNRLEKSEEEIYAGYEIQMKLYALLCGNLKPGQENIDVAIIFTREPGKYLRKNYSKKDLAAFETELSDMLTKIKGIESEDGLFPSAGSLPTISPHCGECEFFRGEGKQGCLLSR